MCVDLSDIARKADLIAAAAIAEVERIEQAYSIELPDSIISSINEAAQKGTEIEVDPETGFLIDHAFEVFKLSDGLFDITSGVLRRVWNDAAAAAPDKTALATLLRRVGLAKILWRRPRLSFTIPGIEIDFGEIAKEYAADRAVRDLPIIRWQTRARRTRGRPYRDRTQPRWIALAHRRKRIATILKPQSLPSSLPGAVSRPAAIMNVTGSWTGAAMDIFSTLTPVGLWKDYSQSLCPREAV